MKVTPLGELRLTGKCLNIFDDINCRCVPIKLKHINFLERFKERNQVIFNGKTTILNTLNTGYGERIKDKTVVKTHKNDTFDREKGFLIAYFIRESGLSKTQVKQYLDSLKESDCN